MYIYKRKSKEVAKRSKNRKITEKRAVKNDRSDKNSPRFRKFP
jgi:hypothetical protein